MSSVTLNRRTRADKEGFVSGSKKSVYPQSSDRESIGYLARYAYRAFVRVLAVELAEHEIHTSQWSALRILWEEEGLSQVELAERMSVEKASLTKTLDGMENLALISRVRNTQDRRKVNIFLTANGRRLKGSLLPYVSKINRQATKGMSSADAEKLKMLLMKVIANLAS